MYVGKHKCATHERTSRMNTKPYANLHLHSTHSDGVYSPTELVTIAKSEGYRALAITDHDTASAYPELRAACEKEGMECLFGVEFSIFEPIACHVVGFSFDPEFPEMKAYLSAMAECATEVTRLCFEEAVENGGITGITWDEVLEYNRGIPWLCNNHVFRAMQNKGLIEESEYMAWFEKNFRDEMAKYPPSYDFLPLDEMVSLIKRAGGFALCAHPDKNQLTKIDMLLDAGIEGLEVLHADMTKDEQRTALSICLEKNLFISGGSDHSGLCGGYYDSFPDEETLHASPLYIEPMSVGVTKEHFEELKTRKIMR